MEFFLLGDEKFRATKAVLVFLLGDEQYRATKAVLGTYWSK